MLRQQLLDRNSRSRIIHASLEHRLKNLLAHLGMAVEFLQIPEGNRSRLRGITENAGSQFRTQPLG